jgi:hypothetical protein
MVILKDKITLVEVVRGAFILAGLVLVVYFKDKDLKVVPLTQVPVETKLKEIVSLAPAPAPPVLASDEPSEGEYRHYADSHYQRSHR